MTDDVPFYVELARDSDGPLVELAVGNGRVAIPVARETGRPVLGIDSSPAMLAQARERATAAGVDLELREGDMRDLELDEPAGLIYVPARSLLHLPTWADRRRVFERVHAALRPGGRFAWNAFVFDPRIAARIDGEWQEQNGIRHRDRPREARQPDRHHARERRHDLALVAEPIRVGRPDRRRRLRGRGALRRLRARAVRRNRERVRLGCPQAQSIRRDSAGLRPVERERHRGRGVLRRGGAGLGRAGGRARLRHRPDLRAGREGRHPRDRRRRVGRDARGRARLRESGGRRATARPAAGRHARAAGRGTRAARADPVPLASCT